MGKTSQYLLCSSMALCGENKRVMTVGQRGGQGVVRTSKQCDTIPMGEWDTNRIIILIVRCRGLSIQRGRSREANPQRHI